MDFLCAVCFDIAEIWFRIANGQILSIFYSYLPITCPYFHFWMVTFVHINGFLPNLICALILWRSGFGLLMGKYCQFLTELSARDMSVFSFLDKNLIVNFNGFSPNWICALILLRSGLGLLMGKFCQF